IIVYVGFVGLTWLADPLFNLMLRFNRYGKFALSRDQVSASNWMALCLTATIVVTGFWLGTGVTDMGFTALAFLMLTMPVTAIFKCQPGWPRRAMAVCAILLAVVAVGGAFLMIAGWACRDRVAYLAGLILSCLAVMGGAASSWIANLLVMFLPKK